ncbi:TA13C protein, partial [Atractosteus spatula]|nr:TA13C protein [Atractosteus spatula]
MLTVCGNLMVIISISHFKQLHTPTNLLLLSLAVADFLIGLIVMPLQMIRYIETCWYFGITFCVFFYAVVTLLSVVSLSNIVLISIDRYLAVCDPLQYSNKITLNIMCMCIILSWSFSVCYVAIMFSMNFKRSENRNTCRGDCFFEMSGAWVIVDTLICFILPYPVMIVLYMKIFIVAKRHAQIIRSVPGQQNCRDGSNSKISKRSERKAAKTLGIIISVHLLCWIPYYLSITQFQAVQYCFQADNSSCIKEVRSTVTYVVMYISAAAVMILTVFGNLMVIISISHFKQLHTPTNLLLLSLAAADFLTGLTVLPFCLILLIETCWYFDKINCIFYNTIGYIIFSVSVYNVTCIAIDRYLAVCDPLLYSTKVTVKMTRLFILFMWLFAVLYNLALIYFNGNLSSTGKTNICLGECKFGISKAWGIADLITVFILPCSVILLLYGKIFVVARRHAKITGLVKRQTVSKKKNRALSTKSQRKAARTLGIVIVVFLLYLSPYFVNSFVNADKSSSSSSVDVNFLNWLVYFNSSLNPIIYALFYPWFQKSVKLIITLQIFNTASSMLNLLPEHS